MYIHVTKIALIMPAMVGNLLVCIAKESMFRLRPLMKSNQDYLCQPLSSKDTWIFMDHLTGNL